jgi:hypothetical protein
MLLHVCLLFACAASGARAAVPAPAAPEFLRSYGTAGSAGALQTPSGVAVLPGGGFVVVEREFQQAVVLTDDGGLVRVLGGEFGSGPGQFEAPSSAAATALGDILIVDTGNSRVQRFSADGALLQVFGAAGSGAGQLLHPTGIAVAPTGDIYVVDQYNQRVVRYSSSGAFELAWGSLGSGPGEFNYPSQVAVDAHGNVYVTDIYNSRVEKFSPTGTFLRAWGSAGTGAGQFTGPVGIAVDELGSVFVGESGGNRIQRFSDRGEWRATFSGPGTAPGQLRLPGQLACGAPGILLVADEDNHDVVRFTPKVFPIGNEPIGLETDTWRFDVFPMGVAAGEHGEAFMVDATRHVYHLGPGGQILHAWYSLLANEFGFQEPAGISFHDGRLYLSDNSNDISGAQLDRMLVFTPEGTLLSQFGTPGNQLGGLNDPSQVRIDAGGVVNVLSLGTSASRVDRFTAQGEFLSRVNVPAAGMTVEPDGDLWGFQGTLLNHYQSNGTLLQSIVVGSVSNGLGFGAAHATADRGVYVLDPAQDAIRRYSTDGTLRGSLTFPSLGNGLTPEPGDIDGSASGDLYVADEGQRVVRRYCTPPIPLSIVDRPADDGGVLTLRFLRSSADVPSEPLHAIGYQILRKMDGDPPPSPQPVPGLPDWEIVTTVNGTGAPEYTVEVPTLSDATPAARMLSTYMVRTLTTPFFLIDSGPITGMSTDDLVPPAPVTLMGQATPEGTILHWRASADPRAAYHVYRGDNSTFELHEGSLVATVNDTSFTDAGASGWFYAITAVDPADHESAAIRLDPSRLLDAPGGSRASEFALRAPFPNPTRGDRLTLEFALTGTERAEVQVFDAAGRVVAGREVGSLGAGPHRIELTPAKALPPGLYLVRLAAAGHSHVRRLVVVH